MTTEEVIKALRVMEHMESIATFWEPGEVKLDFTVAELKEACRVAAAVLLAQNEPNAPLTLEELRDLVGEPVYLWPGDCYVLVSHRR